MIKFIPANLTTWKSVLIDLNIEYMAWIFREIKKNYDFEFDVMPLDENFALNVRKYVENQLDHLIPSDDSMIIKTIFYLVMDRSETIIGMGGLEGLSQEIGMVKRIYIRPEQRGKGYGKEILQHLIIKGKELGFSTLRLDTGKFMTAAIHLYRSAGFYEMEPYPGTEVPAEGYLYWHFMEKIL